MIKRRVSAAEKPRSTGNALQLMCSKVALMGDLVNMRVLSQGAVSDHETVKKENKIYGWF